MKKLETSLVGRNCDLGENKEHNDEAGLEVPVTESGSGQLNGGRKI